MLSHSTLAFKVHSKPFECDDSVFDKDKPKVTMKENQNGTLYHSNSFGRETDSLAFTAKDNYHLNGHGRETTPLEFEAKTGGEPWNSEFVDASAKDNEYGNLNSPKREDPNGILCDREGDADSLDYDIEDNGKLGNNPELERTEFVERFAHSHDNDPRASYQPCIAASYNLFKSGTNLYTDKDITECGLPELEVCYKDVNNNIVKDICVDDGMPTENNVLTERIEDDCKTAKEGIDMEMLIPDGSKSVSLENINDDAINHYGTKISYDKSNLPIVPKLASEISLDKDTVRECDVEDSMNVSEPNDGAFAKTERDVPDAESFVDSKLPMQKFGTRSFLRSFLNSLNSDGNEITQIPSEDAISGGHAALSTNTERNKNVQAGNLLYNSKVDCGSITFNFNSHKPGAAGRTDGCAENVDAQSVKSEDKCHLEILNSVKHLEASAVPCTGNKFKSNGNVHGQSIDLQDMNSTSPDGQVQLVSIKDKNAQNVHDDAIQTHDVFKDEVEKCDSVPVINQVRCEEGESSFSNASLITFSGPISCSGSLSHRSDTSAASARSFAFPVLQSEWNSSPIRMAKADSRRFQRRRSWRSGLLCCRF